MRLIAPPIDSARLSLHTNQQSAILLLKTSRVNAMNNNLFLCVIFTLLSSLCYASIGALIKLEGLHINPYMMISTQYLFALLFAMAYYRLSYPKIKSLFRTSQQKKNQLLRAFFGYIAALGLFVGLQYTSLVNATLILNLAPILLPLLAAFFFRQPFTSKIFFPLMVGFAGIGLVLQPQTNTLFTLGNILPLISAAGMAIALIYLRSLTRTENSAQLTFIYILYSFLFSVITLFGHWQWISLHNIFAMAIIGFLAFLSQVTIAKAAHHGSAQITSIVFYSNVIFAAIFSSILWNIKFTFPSLIGISLTIIGGVFAILFQHQYQKAPT
jgi:drug/metabolite transporter (DMT)-like permease